jgi:nitroreductase
MAPSPDNVQPWRFVAVRSAEARARLAPAAMGQPHGAPAQALIVLYADMEDALATVDEMIHPELDETDRARAKSGFLERFGASAVEERQEYAHGLAYIALGYLLLSAEAMGYSASPLLEFDRAQIMEALGLPAHVTIPALVAIGKAAEPALPRHRHSVDRIARFV